MIILTMHIITRTILLSAALIASISIAQAQWIQRNPAASVTALYDVAWSGNSFIAVGRSGNIIKLKPSTIPLNPGSTLSVETVTINRTTGTLDLTNRSRADLHAVDLETLHGLGLAVGSWTNDHVDKNATQFKASIMRTSDKGDSWQIIDHPALAFRSFNDVEIVDASVNATRTIGRCFIVGSHGTFLSSGNAGQTWSQIDLSNANIIRNRKFNVNDLDGITFYSIEFMGDLGVVLGTAPVTINNAPETVSIALATTNRGTTWYDISGPITDPEAGTYNRRFKFNTHVAFAGQSDVYINAGTNGVNLLHGSSLTANDIRNNTVSWSHLSKHYKDVPGISSPNQYDTYFTYTFGRMAFGVNRGYACSFVGTCMRTDATGPQEKWDLLTPGYNELTGRGFEQDLYLGVETVHVSGNDFVVMTGWKGEVIYSGDNGNSWQRVDNSPMDFLNDVSFADDNFGFAVGDEGTILYTSDRGNNWQKQSPASVKRKNLHGVHFNTDGTEAKAVGNNGLIYNYSRLANGNGAWSSEFSPVNEHLRAVRYSPDGTYCVAVGNSGTILIKQLGTQWQTISFPAGLSDPQYWNFHDVDFVDNTTFCIVGAHFNPYPGTAGADSYRGVILRSDDQFGSSFTISYTDYILQGIDFFDDPATPGATNNFGMAVGYTYRRESAPLNPSNSLIAWRGCVLYTNNAGTTWNDYNDQEETYIYYEGTQLRAKHQFLSRFYDVQMLDDHTAAIAGHGGASLRVEHDNGECRLYPLTLNTNFPLQAICRRGRTNHQLAMVGYKGTILTSDSSPLQRQSISEEQPAYPGESVNARLIDFAQARPNPFIGLTHIDFTLSRSATVTLVVYDNTGTAVAELIRERDMPQGNHNVRLEAYNLPSGIYYFRLQADDELYAYPMMLIR